AKYVEPELELPSPDQEKKRNAILSRIVELEKRAKTRTPELNEEQASWERRIRAASRDWVTIVPARLASRTGAILTSDDTGTILVSGNNSPRETYIVEGALAMPRLNGVRIESLPHATLPRGGPGRDVYGNFLVSTIEVEIARDQAHPEWKAVEFRRPRMDDGRRKHGGWIVDASGADKRLPRQLVLSPRSPI